VFRSKWTRRKVSGSERKSPPSLSRSLGPFCRYKRKGLRLFCCGMGRKKLPQAEGEFVADAAEGCELFFVRAGGVAGISDAPVEAPRSGKRRAKFRGGIAHGDDRVEAPALEFGNGFGAVSGDVDADLAHGLLCPLQRAADRKNVSCTRTRGLPKWGAAFPRCARDKAAPPRDHGQQAGTQHMDLAAGFTARTKALMNLPSICGPTVSGSRPAAWRYSPASSSR